MTPNQSALVDAEATAHIGASPYEHTPTRTTQRNGTREKSVSTTAGDLMVKIPSCGPGRSFPSLLAPRRRIDVALYAVVMEEVPLCPPAVFTGIGAAGSSALVSGSVEHSIQQDVDMRA